MEPQPLVAVRDVEESSLWYRELLGCESGHGGPDYERLVSGDHIILQLHRWDADDHPHMGDPESRPCGNGVLLWFRTDAFDAAVERARGLGVEFLEEPHVNHNLLIHESPLTDALFLLVSKSDEVTTT